jgi:hypothetical protein
MAPPYSSLEVFRNQLAHSNLEAILNPPPPPVAWKLSVISTIWGILAYMYTKAAARATSATPLPMWDVEGSGMVP